MSDKKNNDFDLPPEEEHIVIDDAGISEEDRQDILSQIDHVVEENKIQVTDDLFEIEPKKRGSLFPILINVVILALLGAGIFFAFRYFSQRQETLSMETSSYLSAEGKIIEEIKKESQNKLRRKEQEINAIQQELQELNRQSQELKENMEEQISEREQELRAQLEEELAAERQKLEEAGISEEEIERRMQQLEQERQEEFNRQLQEFREETEAALAEKEEELQQARELTQQILEDANQEKQELQRQTEQRISELQEQFEEERQELRSERSAAQEKLRELSELREREQLIRDQIIGGYNTIIRHIENSAFEQAQQEIEKMKTLLANNTFESIPAIAKRRPIDQYLLTTLEEYLQTKTSEEPRETSSIVDAANLLLGARELISRADTAMQQGQRATAERLYRTALNKVPAFDRAFDAMQSIEKEKMTETISSRIEEGNALIEEGNIEDAVSVYQEAITEVSAAEVETTERAVNNIVQLLRQREQSRLAAKDEEIENLQDRITTLEAALSRRDQRIAGLDQSIGEVRDTLEARTREVARLEETLDEERALQQELEEKLEERSNALQSARTSLENRREEIERLNERIAEKNSEIEQLSATLSNQKGETGELSSTLQEKNQRIRSLRQENDQLQSSLEEREAQIQQLENRVSRRQQEVDRLSGELAQKEQNISTLQERVSSLESELEEQQGRISRERLAEARSAAKSEGRDSAFREILMFISTLKEGQASISQTEQQALQRAGDNVFYSRTIQQITDLAEQRGEERVSEVVLVEQKLLGTVSSVAGTRVVIEPLVTLPVKKGESILVKRKRSASGEQLIAEGNISTVSTGRIVATIDKGTGIGNTPRVMDLVYIEKEQ